MILILGAGGFVGRRFCSFLEEKKIPFTPASREQFNASSSKELQVWLREKNPQFVINAAGFTGKPNVDACESAKADTLAGNTVLPVRIAEICSDLGIPWGHISSGCIYQGQRAVDEQGHVLGFREDDEPNFSFSRGGCSFYSGTKALAEQFLVGHFANLYIWRLRIPFDHRDNSRNYLSKLLRYNRLLEARNSLSNLDDFVASAWATFERRLPFGVYNLTNPGSITTREVVELIRQEGTARLTRNDERTAKQFLKDMHFFGSDEEFMKSGVVTPRSNCVLDTTKAEFYKLPLRPVRAAINDSLQRWEWENNT